MISRKKLTAIVIILMLLVLGLGALYLILLPKPLVPPYAPVIALPERYMVFVDAPETPEDLTFIACLSSIVVHNGYNPMFILDNTGKLDEHQLWTLEHMNIRDVPKLVFTDSELTAASLRNQNITIKDEYVFKPARDVLAKFKGFSGIISVASYAEALWTAPVAHALNKVMVIGESTFAAQEDAWEALEAQGIPARYVVVANPEDYSNASFEDYDAKFHIPFLSAIAAELAAFHSAYVLTEVDAYSIPPETSIGYMDPSRNERAISTLMALRNIHHYYGPIEYIALVGSAAAVPQFLLPDQTSDDPDMVEGDKLVSSDVMFGFLNNNYHMDAAVGRLVNWNVQGISNQVAKTLGYEYMVDEVTVEYTSGVRKVQWRTHGSSFSGYQITWQRLQATPARYLCRDFEDEGIEYEYYGPKGFVGDPVRSTPEGKIEPILEASGFVGYRGHGSTTGSLYSLRVVGPQGEGYLTSEEARELLMPPQVAMFVACNNAKIWGTGWGEGAEELQIERAWATNYLYGGAVVLGGSTEVSFSNIGQDTTALSGLLTDDYEWDMNNAWYAFFWDGILDHEQTYGTVGKALQWAENRYIAFYARERGTIEGYPRSISPFYQEPENPYWKQGKIIIENGRPKEISSAGAYWKEVTMFVIYGDPAFKPYQPREGANNWDPWHNGGEDK